MHVFIPPYCDEEDKQILILKIWAKYSLLFPLHAHHVRFPLLNTLMCRASLDDLMGFDGWFEPKAEEFKR